VLEDVKSVVEEITGFVEEGLIGVIIIFLLEFWN
jgi:hypothetical protein